MPEITKRVENPSNKESMPNGTILPEMLDCDEFINADETKKMTKKDNPVREKILKGLELTHKRLIQYKKERNFDMVVSKDGKVVRIPAKEYDVD
jgi:hypothetical protein